MWLKDPSTRRSSVSLTILVITFIGNLTASVLQMLHKIDNASIMSEMFYAALALYFGRRLSFKGKNVELTGKTLDEKVE